MLNISFILIILGLIAVAFLFRAFKERSPQREVLEDDEINLTMTHCVQCSYWLRGLPDQGRCPECGAGYDKFWGVWQKGKILVMSRQANLPARCIKCNIPEKQFRLKRKLTYIHPAWYVLILLNFVIFIIVALFVQRSATVYLPLCPEHRKRRWMWVGITWLTFLSAVALAVAGVAYESLVWALVGLGLLLISLAFLVIAVPTVTSKYITSDFLWVRGSGPKYLSQLPTLKFPIG